MSECNMAANTESSIKASDTDENIPKTLTVPSAMHLRRKLIELKRCERHLENANPYQPELVQLAAREALDAINAYNDALDRIEFT